MLGIGDKLPPFEVMGVKPGFNVHEEKGQSAFEALNEKSFPGKWKVIFFYPKDFTFVCPTEIAEFARLANEFADRDAVVLGGSSDNEFCKLAWRRDHKVWINSASGNSPTRRARSSTVSACALPLGLRTAIPSSSIPKTRSSTFMRRTLMSGAIRLTRFAFLTRCKPKNCALATALLAGPR